MRPITLFVCDNEEMADKIISEGNMLDMKVTTCELAHEALKHLPDRKDGYDIVISDVNMPDMDGFRLLEHVGLEMDLPVIMMFVDGETSRVLKGVQHGACDYLLNPIRMKELKNLWQHVVRKRMHEISNIECIEDRIRTYHSFDGDYGGDQMFLKERKDVDKHDEKRKKESFALLFVSVHSEINEMKATKIL